MRRRATVVAITACTLLGCLAPGWGHAQAPRPPGNQPVAVGPLTLAATPVCDGRLVQVVVSLHTVAVAAATLTPQAPRYSFDVTVGVSKAKGEMTSMFMPAGQLSTTIADVVVTTEGQSPQPFKGLIQSWVIAGASTYSLTRAQRVDCASQTSQRR